MESKKSNKIREIVHLQQLVKKWRKWATTKSTTTTINKNGGGSAAGSPNVKKLAGGGISLLKKTLSFSSSSSTAAAAAASAAASASNSGSGDVSMRNIPKGCLAVCVGMNQESVKRYVIPTDYLSHESFAFLLREAEEEFGFQNHGVLRIPCEVTVFETVLRRLTVLDQDRDHRQDQSQIYITTSDRFRNNNTGIDHSTSSAACDNYKYCYNYGSDQLAAAAANGNGGHDLDDHQYYDNYNYMDHQQMIGMPCSNSITSTESQNEYHVAANWAESQEQFL